MICVICKRLGAVPTLVEGVVVRLCVACAADRFRMDEALRRIRKVGE